MNIKTDFNLSNYLVIQGQSAWKVWVVYNNMTGLRVSLFIAVAIISATHATNLIYKIGVNTAACDDCGMSNTFGALRMQVKL